jgi:hypothetical protein
MSTRIPIADAKTLAAKHSLKQVIILAWDGDKTHVVTYGVTLADCAQAAEGGNRMKRVMGWPEDMCAAVPARVRRRRR